MTYARVEEVRDNLIQITSNNIAKLKNLSQYAPENYINKVILLDAELAVVRNDMHKSKACLKDAFSLSRKHGFIHDEALAYERE